LKAIGIAAPQRHPLFPEVKTFDEMGIKGMDLNNWSAVYVSKQVPAAVVNDLNRAIRRALENPEVKARLSATGTDPQGSSPEELAALVQSDLAKWTRIIKAFNIKPE
jgi:tripartite-type tricarboxylate transporter receptor subunit TctC